MSQDLNPYASPLTPHAPSTPSRYLSWHFAFLVLDLCISLTFAVPTVLYLAVGGPSMDVVYAMAFFLLPAVAGAITFMALIGRKRWSVSAARIIGGYGVLLSLIGMLFMLWTVGVDFFGILILVVRAMWNVAYISAAKSFAKK